MGLRSGYHQGGIGYEFSICVQFNANLKAIQQVSTLSQLGFKKIFRCQICLFKGLLHLLPQKAQKLACFVLDLKVTNIFFKKNICIL